MSEDYTGTGDLKDVLKLNNMSASELGVEAPKEEDPKPESSEAQSDDTHGEGTEEAAGSEETQQSPQSSDLPGDDTAIDLDRDAAQAQLDSATAPSPAAVAGEAEGPHDEAPVAQETVDESTDAKGSAHTLALGDGIATEDPAPAALTPDVVDESGMGGENGTEQTAHGVDPLAAAAPVSEASSSTEPDASPTESTEGGSEEPEAEHEPEFVDVVYQLTSVKDVLGADILDHFKKAGNCMTKALKGFGPHEEALAKLDNEAKARFGFVRQKSTEFVAALELMFYRE